jgi:hypothetical protein
MERRFLFATAVTGLALLVAAAVTAAHATPRRASGCVRVDAIKAVFPKAGTMGFNTRSRTVRMGRRHPYWPEWCSNWSTSYSDQPDQKLRPSRAFAQVSVSLYKTHGDALVALAEPAFGVIRTLPYGVQMRTLVASANVNGDASRQAGYVASVVGNVFISSNGQGRPPHYQGSEAVRAQMRIHRRIHAAVLALG